MTNSTFVDACLLRVGAGEVEHLVGHVEADRLAAGGDAAGADQDVGAGAGTEIEHGLAGLEVGDRGRNAAPERRGDRVLGALASSCSYSVEPNTLVSPWLVELSRPQQPARLQRLRASDRKAALRPPPCAAVGIVALRTASRMSVQLSHADSSFSASGIT